MKTALITLHSHRLKYSKRVMDAMDHQCKGLHHFAGIENIEGQKEGIYALMESKQHLYESTQCFFNPKPHHTNNNLKRVLAAFLESDCDSYIYLEDDTLPSKGAVEYLKREYELNRRNHNFSHVSLSPKNDGRQVTESNLLQSEYNETWIGMWGYMAGRETAITILEGTPDFPFNESGENVWDQRYTQYFLRNGLYAVQPFIARMQNIGEEGGLHRGGHTWQTWEGL